MIIHSVIPVEEIFKNEFIENHEVLYMSYMGYKIEARKIAQDTIIINRVLETSPKSYLHPELQPGMVIKKGS